MLFTEPVFLFLFLPLTLAIYFACGRRLANGVLVAAGFVFYAFGEQVFVAGLAGCIVFNYLIGLWMRRARGGPWERTALWAGVAGNIGLLIVFKYSHFVLVNLHALMKPAGFSFNAPEAAPLPLGISFFTFHAITYIVDIHKRANEPQKNPLSLALYITLFPQLVAGPITRYSQIAGQLARRTITREGFADGVLRFVIGLSKKRLIADTLAAAADNIFSAPAAQLTTDAAWLGAVCYTLQIYFDFSGYTDMAVGLGRMFGFRLPENFNYPYTSRSITEFWRRWHITLSTWFRDYVYIPLGGSRRGTARTYFNLVAVFALCGLWHGPEWKFMAWGLFHGAFLILERAGFSRVLASGSRAAAHVYTLLVVIIGWVFFRADTLGHALIFIKAMAGFAPGNAGPFHAPLYFSNDFIAALIAACVFSMPAAPALEARLRGRLSAARAVFAAAALALCISDIAAGTYTPFLYFKF